MHRQLVSIFVLFAIATLTLSSSVSASAKPREVQSSASHPNSTSPLKSEPTSMHLANPTQSSQSQPTVASPNSPTGWVQMMSEAFEPTQPDGTWSVFGYPTWDVTAYLAHTGSWSAWCARSVISPWTDNYTNTMDAKIRFGPYDLSDATRANLKFYYWNQSDQGYDFFQWRVSIDGSNYYGYQTSGDSGGWTYVDFDLTNVPTLVDVTGQSSVWIEFRFTSDSTITYKGAFIDNVSLEKFVPSQVTVYGYFTYPDENDTIISAPLALTYLYDASSMGTDTLIAGPIYTDQNGYFQFPPVTNWNQSENRRLNLYVVWQSRTIDSMTATHQVRDLANNLYQFYSDIITNAPDGPNNINGPVPIDMPERKALWIWRDLRRSWEYVYSYGGETFGSADPGSVIVEWQNGVNSLLLPYCPHSCFYSGAPFIFIADDQAFSTDSVVHETAHYYMWNSNHWNAPTGEHSLWDPTNSSLAWAEGWSDFFPLSVNGDACFNWDNNNSCPNNSDPVNGVNLEWRNRLDGLSIGDNVEGRVAGALYDLLDTRSDWYDDFSYPFYYNWAILAGEPHTLNNFWIAWKNRGYDKHGAVQSIFQNGIDYDTPPTIGPLPDVIVFKNTWRNQALDLWMYSSDPESLPSQLGFTIFNTPNPNCGVSLQSHPNDRFISVTPIMNWTGSCDVTISALDGIYSRLSSFTVRVVEPKRIFLPLIMK